MSNVNPIGGYFELEVRNGEHYHQKAIRLNTACNSFEYVLRVRQYRKVYIPYYTCEVMLKPLEKLGVDYEFYHINEIFEVTPLPTLKDGEAILYTNYFGLKQAYVHYLTKVYGAKLIVDNAQAFFAEPISGIETFYSARKFFGVPDGAFLYTSKLLEQDIEQDVSYERMAHLLKRIELGAEAGYLDFKKNDDYLCDVSIKMMSKLTESLLKGVDYELAKKKRRENYSVLDAQLGRTNKIHLELDTNSVPLVYPYLTDDTALKQKLIQHEVFVATYWPNVFEWCKPDDWEYELAERTVFIPVDQRYCKEEMNRIIEIIKK